MTVRALKGLTDVIGLSVVHPTFQKTRPDNPDDKHYGWTFSDEELSNANGYGHYKVAGTTPDTVNNFKYLRDIYESVNDTVGKNFYFY